jgi:hypothetical protein
VGGIREGVSKAVKDNNLQQPWYYCFSEIILRTPPLSSIKNANKKVANNTV